MLIQRVYLDENNFGTVLCQDCQESQHIDFSEFKGQKQPIQIKCPCGEIQNVKVDFRKSFRKGTTLFGKYIKHGDLKEKGTVNIFNLSYGGMGFYIYGNNHLNVGDTITVNFNLDDPNKLTIEKTVEIKNIREKYIGAKFVFPINRSDKILSTYLEGKNIKEIIN